MLALQTAKTWKLDALKWQSWFRVSVTLSLLHILKLRGVSEVNV
jgi:hypothetical protein